MTEITYEDLPSSWAFCFNEQCSLKDRCLKYLTTSLIPDDVKTANVLLPKCYREHDCEFFQEKRLVTVAWGFEKLFYDVKGRDVAEIRQEMFDTLKSRTSYYRYSTGERRLLPEQQEQVLAIFRRHGYTENLEFDHYKESWVL